MCGVGRRTRKGRGKMREIITAALLLAMLLAGVAVNNCIIRDFCRDATAMIGALPTADDDGCVAAVGALTRLWDERRTAVSFSVSYDDIERISEKLALLTAAAELGDAVEFEARRAELASAVGHAARLERLGFESIF